MTGVVLGHIYDYGLTNTVIYIIQILRKVESAHLGTFF